MSDPFDPDDLPDFTPCAAEDCKNEGEHECDDCTQKVCDDHWITCSDTDAMDGCDAGLCPQCYDEHVSEHTYQREYGDDGSDD